MLVYNLTFEETLKRHNSSPKKTEFGEEALRKWWREKDYLGVPGETFLTNDMSEDDIFTFIIKQLQK